MSTIIAKDPWPQTGIRENTSIDDYVWGYLYTFDDGQVEFRPDENPTHAEIMKRWALYLTA